MEPTVHTDKYDLYLADCLDVMQDMEAGSMDAILTDIPYGTTACAWDIIIPFDKMWEGVKRVLKPRGVFVTTASQPFTSKLVMSNLEWFKYEWIWNKKRGSGSILAKVMPIKFHENIIVFSAGGHDYYPQMRTGVSQSKASGGKSSVYREKIPVVRVTNNLYYPRSILDFTGCHNMTGKVHPTQKPYMPISQRHTQTQAIPSLIFALAAAPPAWRVCSSEGASSGLRLIRGILRLHASG